LPCPALPCPALHGTVPSAPQFEGSRNVPAFGSDPVLNHYDLDGASKWAWLGWLTLFFAVFWVLTWLALSTVRHQRR